MGERNEEEDGREMQTERERDGFTTTCRERERERERNGRADGVRTGGLWAAAGAR